MFLQANFLSLLHVLLIDLHPRTLTECYAIIRLEHATSITATETAIPFTINHSLPTLPMSLRDAFEAILFYTMQCHATTC